MSIWSSLSGLYQVEIVSAATQSLIDAANADGIRLYHIVPIDDLRSRCEVLRRDFDEFKSISEGKGASIQIVAEYGIYWAINKLLKRPVLLFGILILFFLEMYVPTRVFFIKVTGNDRVTTSRILDAAERVGVGFGASRQLIRSEKIKNALLSEIPELQWAGVNTYGCVAVISVCERSNASGIQTITSADGIVADRDGIIQELTVTSGVPLCKVGQAVKKGQMLVSSYQDLGIVIKATNVEAEIRAQTQRIIRAFTPVEYMRRGTEFRKETRYSIILGKNIIKLYNGSGISDTTCVKMYETIYLQLPGRFYLPLAFVREELYYTDCNISELLELESYSWFEQSVQDYVVQQMIAGSVLQSEHSIEIQQHCASIYGKYFCSEMIGKSIMKGS